MTKKNKRTMISHVLLLVAVEHTPDFNLGELAVGQILPDTVLSDEGSVMVAESEEFQIIDYLAQNEIPIEQYTRRRARR